MGGTWSDFAKLHFDPPSPTRYLKRNLRRILVIYRDSLIILHFNVLCRLLPISTHVSTFRYPITVSSVHGILWNTHYHAASRQLILMGSFLSQPLKEMHFGSCTHLIKKATKCRVLTSLYGYLGDAVIEWMEGVLRPELCYSYVRQLTHGAKHRFWKMYILKTWRLRFIGI